MGAGKTARRKTLAKRKKKLGKGVGGKGGWTGGVPTSGKNEILTVWKKPEHKCQVGKLGNKIGQSWRGEGRGCLETITKRKRRNTQTGKGGMVRKGGSKGGAS